MAKKTPKKHEEIEELEEYDIQIESWQWETNHTRLTWKHWLVMAILLAVAILFAFGFLIIAAVLLIIGIIIHIIAFIFKKLS
jgi:uncharacterized ion transporter superfamily protein YfcC